MTDSDIASKNLNLAFEVIRQVLAEPKVTGELDALAAGGTLVLYDPEDAALTTANDRIEASLRERGEQTVPVELTRRLRLTPR